MKDKLLALRPYVLRFVGYPLFFMFWFVTFVYVTFPYDRLKEAIVSAVEAPRRAPGGAAQPSNIQMTIGDLGPTFFPGISARNVSVTFLPTKTGERALTMRMDRVAAHVGLFALAGGNVSADIDIDGMGGRVEAHVDSAMRGTRPGLRDLRLSLDHVRIGEIAPLVAIVGLPLSGAMDGTVELHIPDGQIEQATGATHVTVDDLRIGDGHAQYQIPRFGGITIEQIRAGRLDGAITIREGRATIDRLTARSPEFTFQ
ncbi:MAG: type II secretion system protein GspN, partial [Deltaproteobacteria bacterium]